MKRIINGFEVDWASERMFAEHRSVYSLVGSAAAGVAVQAPRAAGSAASDWIPQQHVLATAPCFAA